MNALRSRPILKDMHPPRGTLLVRKLNLGPDTPLDKGDAYYAHSCCYIVC